MCWLGSSVQSGWVVDQLLWFSGSGVTLCWEGVGSALSGSDLTQYWCPSTSGACGDCLQEGAVGDGSLVAFGSVEFMLASEPLH